MKAGVPFEVSFCTTAMGRLHHVRQTLPQNLDWHKTAPGVEFVLVDYSSADGLSDWVKKDLSAWLDTGTLSFYQVAGYQEFDWSHAKNIAHRAARGRIVCNIDADVFAGPNFADILVQEFAKCERMFVGLRRNKGCIAMRKDDFVSLGGYDERFVHGWSHEDTDLMRRAEAWGLRKTILARKDGFPRFIRHGDEERTQNHKEKDVRRSNHAHRELSRASLAAGEFEANQSKTWGKARVVRNFTEVIAI